MIRRYSRCHECGETYGIRALHYHFTDDQGRHKYYGEGWYPEDNREFALQGTRRMADHLKKYRRRKEEET